MRRPAVRLRLPPPRLKATLFRVAFSCFASVAKSSMFSPSKISNFRNLSNFHVQIPPKFQTSFGGTNLFSIRLIALRIKIIHWMIFIYAVSNFYIPSPDKSSTYPQFKSCRGFKEILSGTLSF